MKCSAPRCGAWCGRFGFVFQAHTRQPLGAQKLQFRLEIFNLFNRANFGTPTRTVFAGATQNDPVLPTAGQITRTVNTSRQLQFSAKVTF